MKWVLLATLLIIGFIAVARGQSFPNAIRVFADRVEFDWMAVNACAATGERICRIALAARNSR